MKLKPVWSQMARYLIINSTMKVKTAYLACVIMALNLISLTAQITIIKIWPEGMEREFSMAGENVQQYRR